MPPIGSAQTGSVQGQVVDRAGAALPGVTVVVDGTSRNALTDENGRHLLREIPPGSHQVAASDFGFQRVTQPVRIRPGAISVLDFVLEVAAVEVEGITVEAQRGIVRTLKDKRRSPVILGVLDREQLQRLPLLYVPEGTRLEQRQSEFQRFSGTAKLDWRPTPATELGLRLLLAQP